MFKVETGIPVPQVGDRRKLGKYGFGRMKDGQSIFVPHEKVGGPAYEAARKYAKRNGVTLTCRTVEGGLRIWKLS